ncbi:MAG TPA: hypothetical protein VMZ53_11855 [Kofleriaceae bacterium]|nr:hypothetical protein [Kofleriaceae bacterium]
MSPDDDDLPSIDPAALDTVTGGTASNDDVTAAITSLSNDLKDFVSSQKNQGSNTFQQMLPFLLMMSGGNWSFSSSGGFNCSGGGGGCGRCGRRGCAGNC